MQKILISSGSGRVDGVRLGLFRALQMGGSQSKDIAILVPLLTSVKHTDLAKVLDDRMAKGLFGKTRSVLFDDGCRIRLFSKATLPSSLDGQIVLALWPHPKDLAQIQEMPGAPHCIIGVPNSVGELDEWGDDAETETI